MRNFSVARRCIPEGGSEKCHRDLALGRGVSSGVAWERCFGSESEFKREDLVAFLFIRANEFAFDELEAIEGAFSAQAGSQFGR